jgi:hypothetical protein
MTHALDHFTPSYLLARTYVRGCCWGTAIHDIAGSIIVEHILEFQVEVVGMAAAYEKKLSFQEGQAILEKGELYSFRIESWNDTDYVAGNGMFGL